ncbi:MAG TPA: hypothetical protein PK580_04085 [Nitrosomonas halophila]|nr:hypothetical protein [Nitrosomonas halophila]
MSPNGLNLPLAADRCNNVKLVIEVGDINPVLIKLPTSFCGQRLIFDNLHVLVNDKDLAES